MRLEFYKTGGDFDDPTKEGLLKTVEILARKAKEWDTPNDII